MLKGGLNSSHPLKSGAGWKGVVKMYRVAVKRNLPIWFMSNLCNKVFVATN